MKNESIFLINLHCLKIQPFSFNLYSMRNFLNTWKKSETFHSFTEMNRTKTFSVQLIQFIPKKKTKRNYKLFHPTHKNKKVHGCTKSIKTQNLDIDLTHREIENQTHLSNLLVAGETGVVPIFFNIFVFILDFFTISEFADRNFRNLRTVKTDRVAVSWPKWADSILRLDFDIFPFFIQNVTV